MGFVNIHGQPIDWAGLHARQAEEARRRYVMGIAPSRKPTVKRGYAAEPGSGPTNKRCADCEHKRSFGGPHGGKHFIKCELRRPTWTNGEGTDILARTPACCLFKQKES